MEINELKKRPDNEQNNKLTNKFFGLEKLIYALRKKELPTNIITSINEDIELINSFSGSNHELLKQLGKVQNRILKLIEKELKIVPKNHYRNLWMVLGMSAFGVPIGVSLGLSLGNLAFLAIGFPIGMAIGIAIGSSMDKKAIMNGKQLDIEIKY
jgi:hypothetical protein